MDVLTEVRAIVGEGNAREAGPRDGVDGVVPRAVASPGTVEEVSAVMKLANRGRLGVAPRGGGTQMVLGNPPERLHLILDTTRMNRVLEHAAGDLVASVEAGVPVATLQEELAGAGQMLAIDGGEDGGTVGGLIAANASGPRRHRYGTARDLLIGITVVLADGTVAKAGGKVVKNVAGYDLAKLMTGSLGTLGVVVKAVFRLHPRTRSQRVVEADPRSAEDLEAAVQRLLHSPLVPTAIVLSWPLGAPGRVGVLFEGEEPSVIAQAETASELLGAAMSPVVHDESDLGSRWGMLAKGPVPAESVEVKVSCLPAALTNALGVVRGAAARHRGPAHLNGALGSGVLHLRLERPDPLVAAAIVKEIRSKLKVGTAVVTAAPPEFKRQLDVWGPVGTSLGLMKRVKERFDPERILNPGRFVGGI
jgi:glycolate oxidase FAD binding subunit